MLFFSSSHVNGRDPRLSVGGIAPTGAYRAEVPRPQALKVIVYYKVRKTQRPQIANSAVWGLYILKSKCQRREGISFIEICQIYRQTSNTQADR